MRKLALNTARINLFIKRISFTFAAPIFMVMTKTNLSIPFKGLSAGNHSFDFEIGKQFFESFEYFEGINGKLLVQVNLLKESNLMNLDIRLQGIVNLQCDRCLGSFKQPIEGSFILIIKFGETFEEESDEIIVLPFTESIIDLSPHFFDYINMLLPLQKVHPVLENGESGCDPEMIAKLNTYSKQKEDPRWEALKKLKLK
jgi:uncharacterized metal-binding protein YceD (DUF177 family)